MRGKGFSLIELVLVVAILGILGALVMPVYQGQAAEAKTSSAKTNLGVLRAQIEFYKIHHKGSVPGYINGAGAPIATMQLQLTGTTTDAGMASPNPVPTGPFLHGPYLRKIPANPFNKLSNIAYVAEATPFSTAVDGTSSGWLYKKETAEIRINQTGLDDEGIAYINY